MLTRDWSCHSDAREQKRRNWIVIFVHVQGHCAGVMLLIAWYLVMLADAFYTFGRMLNELRTYLSMPYFLMVVLRWKIDLEGSICPDILVA